MSIPFRKNVCVLLIATTPLWGMPGKLLADGGAAAERSAHQAEKVDVLPVRLSGDHRLRGQAKTASGEPAAGVPVVLGVNGKPVGRVMADEQGRFEFGPIRPGHYQIATKDAVAVIEAHTASAAPEQALQTVEVSQGAMIARGQSPAQWLTHPLFIGLIIAAAIAIPLAIAFDDDDDDDAS